MSMLFASLCFGLLCAGYVSGYATNDYALEFPSAGVTNYVNIRGMRSLTQFTLCFCMKSSDTSNDGTPFSYAVPGEDNELLLFNYKAFKVFIRGESRSAGFSANDGQWHHICVTWTNTNGAWKFYKDGVLHHHSIGFKTGQTIRGGGSLVLGQDQDGFGTGFQSSQSFVGSMAGVNVWSSVLSASVIQSYSQSCLNGAGSVYKWADFIHGIKGNTAIVIPCPS